MQDMPKWLEIVLLATIFIGTACSVVGWVWGWIVGRRISLGWSIGILLFAIIALPCFAYNHPKIGKRPLILFLGGVALLYGATAFIPRP